MRKKIVIGLVLSFLLLFSFSETILATCITLPVGSTCLATSCSTTLHNYCCANPNECTNQQTTDNASSPTTSGSSATTTGSSGSELCGNGINTAIGCIPVLANDNGVSFMGWILKWSVGIGGGIAFLLILYGGFMVMTSQANPERIKAGQELISSAIAGLLLLVLSIFLLKFIGVDILGLGAFGFGK